MNVIVFHSTTTLSSPMKKLLGFLSFSFLPVKLSRHSCRIKYCIYRISVTIYKITMSVKLHYCTTESRPASKWLIAIARYWPTFLLLYNRPQRSYVALNVSSNPYFFIPFPFTSIVIIASKSANQKTIAGTYVLFGTIPKAIGNRAGNTT